MRMSRRNPRKLAPVMANARLYPDATERFPDRRFDKDHILEIPGPAICERCHAFLMTDHWQYDEQRYQKLHARDDVKTTLCPGCSRVERRLYEGEVTVRHQWDSVSKDDIVHLIHNTEARVRVANPTARIAVMEERDNEIYILTTTQFLAERIGKALYRAYKGKLVLKPLLRERFSRVWWERE